MTGEGNNTYLLFSNPSSVLIDAGVGHPDHVASLGQALDSNGAALRAVLVTHDHADHASGVVEISSAFPAARFAKYSTRDDIHRFNLDWHALRDGDEVGFGDEILTVLHTPGHAPDHIALWHEGTGAVFSGDLVNPSGSVMIDPARGGDLRKYLESLERLISLGPRTLMPAHGPTVDDPEAVVRRHIEHRRMRERQIVDAVAGGRRTVEAIAESIYDDLEPRLLAAARATVRAHLEKLRADGTVADEDGWRLL